MPRSEMFLHCPLEFAVNADGIAASCQRFPNSRPSGFQAAATGSLPVRYSKASDVAPSWLQAARPLLPPVLNHPQQVNHVHGPIARNISTVAPAPSPSADQIQQVDDVHRAIAIHITRPAQRIDLPNLSDR